MRGNILIFLLSIVNVETVIKYGKKISIEGEGSYNRGKDIWDTLVFVLNGAMRQGFNFYFWAVFCWYQNVLMHFGFFLRGDWPLGYIVLWGFEIFLIFSNFLCLFFSCMCTKARPVFGNLWSSLHIPCLLLIITLRFTCGEKKIW